MLPAEKKLNKLNESVVLSFDKKTLPCKYWLST